MTKNTTAQEWAKQTRAILEKTDFISIQHFNYWRDELNQATTAEDLRDLLPYISDFRNEYIAEEIESDIIRILVKPETTISQALDIYKIYCDNHNKEPQDAESLGAFYKVVKGE